MNVPDNITVSPGYAGVAKKKRYARAKELLQEFQVESVEKNHPLQLSGGEQQRISIMKAISNKP